MTRGHTVRQVLNSRDARPLTRLLGWPCGGAFSGVSASCDGGHVDWRLWWLNTAASAVAAAAAAAATAQRAARWHTLAGMSAVG